MRLHIAAIALCMFGLLGAYGQARKAILVAPLDSELLGEEERRLATDAVISRIMGSARYTVVSEAGRELALQEIERSRSLAFAESAALDAGKLIEADYVLSMGAGRIGDGRYYAILRLIEVRSGKLASAASQEFPDLDRIVERMESLASKALQIEGAVAAIPVSEEVLFVSPSGYKVFEAVGLGGVYFAEAAAAREISSFGLAAGFSSIYGRPIGFYYDAAFLYPLKLVDAGAAQNWLGELGFPWGVNLHAGVSWLASPSDSLLIGLAVGLHTIQFQFYAPWNVSSEEYESVLGSDPSQGFYWNFGAFLGLEAFLRVSKRDYVILGCTVDYDFKEILPISHMDPGYALKHSWSIAPTISISRGK